MKNTKDMKAILLGTGIVVIPFIGVWFFGNMTWILSALNLLWIFFKGGSLLSWWWVIGSAIGFLVSLITIVGIQFWIVKY